MVFGPFLLSAHPRVNHQGQGHETSFGQALILCSRDHGVPGAKVSAPMHLLDED